MRSGNVALTAVLALAIACVKEGSPPETSPAEPAAANPAAQGNAAQNSKPTHVAPHFAEGNGRVIEAPVPGSAEVAIRVLFYSGSTDDPAGKEGLTELTAQLMAQGGTQKLSYPELLRALYPMATAVGVSTDKEQTVFSARVHVDHVARFVPIFTDVIKEPRFAEADFARIRQDMVNEIEKSLRTAADEDLGKQMLSQMLYDPKHPYGHYDGGTVKGLQAITLDDVKAHAAKVFGKKRMLIGVGGSAESNAKDLLQSALGALPEGSPRMLQIPSVPKPSRPEVLIAEKPVRAAAISIGFTHEAFRGHPDWPALGLVQSYFGEHRQFHGVLMSEMREKRGLNYGDYAYLEKFIQQGGSRHALTNIARRQQHFEIWIRPVDPKETVFSIRLAMYLLDRLVREGVPEKGVDDTKKFLAGYTRLWDLTAMRKVGFALDDQFYGTSGYLDAYRAELAKLGKKDVDAAIGRHLVAWPVKIAIVAPDPAALEKQLLSGEKTEKQYNSKVDPAVLEMDKAVSVFPLKLTDADIRIVKADELFVE